MNNFLKTVALIFALLFGTLAHAQTAHVPTLESDNVWTGLNIYTPGNLQLTEPYSACPAGEFVTGLDATFAPSCSSASGILDGGPVVYPAQCQQGGTIPSWCGGPGLTADKYITNGCATLPSTGGVINLAALTGTLANSVTCSTPTKQVYILQDTTVALTVTETDGGTVFPLGNYSALLGPGVGQCLFGSGIKLASTANIAGVAGPLNTVGGQEAFMANGLCITGSTGATVSKGLIFAEDTFVNTTISGNYLIECNHACLWMSGLGGTINVEGNEFNVSAGNPNINGIPLVIINSLDVNVGGNNAEHANGAGNPEILIQGNGSNASSESIWIHDGYVERGADTGGGVPDTDAILIEDCVSCTVENVGGLGTVGGTNFVHITQTHGGGTENVEVRNALGGAWTNVLKDDIEGVTYPLTAGFTIAHYISNAGISDAPCSPLSGNPQAPYNGQCWTSPTTTRQFISGPGGVNEYAWLSDLATSVQSAGPDVLLGAGNFESGSSSLGTGFTPFGCGTSILTCTYTRTNSTAAVGTYSQEVQVTANPDTGYSENGVETTSTFSFTAGQSYVVAFYAKSDGTIPATGMFQLGDFVGNLYCYNTTGPLTTTWTRYAFICQPTVSGTSFLNVGAVVAPGGLGTFYVDDLTFQAVQTLTPGAILAANGPYSIGAVPGTLYSAAGTPLPTCNTAEKGAQFVVSDATSPTYLGTYTSGGSTVASVLCNGGNWVTH
jgi:hypothetical protein